MTYHDINIGMGQTAVSEADNPQPTDGERAYIGVLADDIEEAIPILDRFRIVGLRIKGWTIRILRKADGRTATQEAPAVKTSPPESRDSLQSGGSLFHSEEVGGSIQAKGEHEMGVGCDGLRSDPAGK